MKCVAADQGTGNAPHMVDAVDNALAIASDIGRRHAGNEDWGAVRRLADGRMLLVVSDGVSTAISPAAASKAAIEQVIWSIEATSPNEDQQGALRNAIVKAHVAVSRLEQGGEESNCTIVAAIVKDGRAAIGWVGDSRAYLISQEREVALTRDDSWAEEVVSAGTMTLEAASADSRAHWVTQVLGMQDAPINIHIEMAEITTGDTLLLCTDGLWNYFGTPGSLGARLQEIRRQNTGAADALTCCRELVADANRLGGRDNITVALLDA
jgi:serine/threonine protein phosphatase PrpC